MSPHERMDQLSQTGKHQGVIAKAAAYAYAQVEDMLKLAEEKGEPPFLILLDGIEDPRNLGAIIRTANIAGAHGVIIPKRRAAGLDCHGGENIRRCSEFHAGGEGHQPGVHNGRVKETGAVVCVRGYGRTGHV